MFKSVKVLQGTRKLQLFEIHSKIKDDNHSSYELWTTLHSKMEDEKG